MGNDPKTVKRILIVDDCEEDRVICKRMLGTVGMGDCEFVWADVGVCWFPFCHVLACFCCLQTCFVVCWLALLNARLLMKRFFIGRPVSQMDI